MMLVTSSIIGVMMLVAKRRRIMIPWVSVDGSRATSVLFFGTLTFPVTRRWRCRRRRLAMRIATSGRAAILGVWLTVKITRIVVITIW